ncbi:MAG: hypothetical protein AAF518_03565 [Spirochaetota bacterium]
MKALIYIFIAIVVLTTAIYPVEEKGKAPFFYLSKKRIQLNLSPGASKLCRIYSRELVLYRKYKVKDCYKTLRSFRKLFPKILQENKEKKEIMLMFFDSLGERLTPKVTLKEGIFQVQTIVYIANDKSFFLELIDGIGKYYFYKVDPKYLYLTN